MFMLKKTLKWAAIIIVVLIAIVVIGLAINGLPKPGAITVDGVPRVPIRGIQDRRDLGWRFIRILAAHVS